MGKIIITDNIVADTRSKSMSVNDVLAKTYESDIADKIKENPKFANFKPLDMALYDAGLSKKSIINDFYTTSDNVFLFPAIVETRLHETLSNNPMLGYVVGSEQTINATSIKAPTIDLTSEANKKSLEKRDISEGAELPIVEFKTGSQAISLFKRGFALQSTYEAMMYSPLDMFLRLLDYMANNAANQQLGDVINVLVKGDGNDNAAIVDKTSVAKLTNEDLVKFSIAFCKANNNIPLDTIICGDDIYATLVQMVTASTNENEYRLGSGFNFPQTMFKDLNVIYDSRVPTGAGSKAQLIGLNKANAITKYIAAGSQISEIAANIRNQTKIGTLSEIVGFAKAINPASRILQLA